MGKTGRDGKRAKQGPSYGRVLLRVVLAVLVVAVLLLNLFTHVFSAVQYYGSSMEPALQDRQLLVVHKTDKVHSGDIVAFYYNNKVLVRRIIAEGGVL
jgi:signal peptidase I